MGRRRYSTGFEEQALRRAEEDGVVVATRDMGLVEARFIAGGGSGMWGR